MLAKALKGFANIQAPNLDRPPQLKKVNLPEGFFEKKNILSQKGDQISGLDGI